MNDFVARMSGYATRWSPHNQHEAAQPVTEREAARMPVDSVERVGPGWPASRGHSGWWDRRRGPRVASWAVRIAIKQRMAELDPDVYVYFNSTHDAPDQDFDDRWEAVVARSRTSCTPRPTRSGSDGLTSIAYASTGT